MGLVCRRPGSRNSSMNLDSAFVLYIYIYIFFSFLNLKVEVYPPYSFHHVNTATNHHIFTASRVTKRRRENLAPEFHFSSLQADWSRSAGTHLTHSETLHRATVASLSQDVPAVKMVNICSTKTNDSGPIERCKESQTHTRMHTHMHTHVHHIQTHASKMDCLS